MLTKRQADYIRPLVRKYMTKYKREFKAHPELQDSLPIYLSMPKVRRLLADGDISYANLKAQIKSFLTPTYMKPVKTKSGLIMTQGEIRDIRRAVRKRNAKVAEIRAKLDVLPMIAGGQVTGHPVKQYSPDIYTLIKPIRVDVSQITSQRGLIKYKQSVNAPTLNPWQLKQTYLNAIKTTLGKSAEEEFHDAIWNMDIGTLLRILATVTEAEIDYLYGPEDAQVKLEQLRDIFFYNTDFYLQ